MEYREGANFISTELLLEGKNPFDYSNNPQSANLYGIFNNLLLFPFAKIWGPTILLHRIAAGFFVLACCLIVILVLKKSGAPLLFSCAAGVMLYPFLLFPNSSTALGGPHSLGVFLFLTAFFLPYFLNYSNTSLNISILCGLLAFYTKTYFVLSIPLTASYIFLFKSKQKGFLYGLKFLIFFILSIYIINSIMNCYFNNIFFAMSNGVQTQWASVDHAVEQLKFFYQQQKPLFLFLGVYVIIQGVFFIKNIKAIFHKEFFLKFNLFTWQEPLLKWNFNINLYGLIICTLAIYFVLGRSGGQFMPYLYQLMSPFFILYIFNCLYKQRLLSPFLFLPILNYIYKQRLITIAGMVLIIINLFTLSSGFSKNFHEFDNNWREVDDLIAADKNIFASPYFVPLLIQHKRPVYDTGASEYFQYGEGRDFLNFKSPKEAAVSQRVDALSHEIQIMLSQKKFDLLIILPDYHPFLPDDYTLYYRPIKIIKLNNFQNYKEFTDYTVLIPK